MKLKLGLSYSGVALRRQAKKTKSGLETHGVSLGIDGMLTDFAADLLASKTTQSQFRDARMGKIDAFKTLREESGLSGEFIQNLKGALLPHLGNSWSSDWMALNFNLPSLEIPKGVDGRVDVLEGAEEYFTAHPTHEVALTKVTKAEAILRLAALEAADLTVTNCRTDTLLKLDLRDKALATLRSHMRMVATALERKLGPLDGRWIAFGFSRPGETERPDVVTGLVLDNSTPTHLGATWNEAARAVRYRVQILVVGVDTDFRQVEEEFEEHTDLNTFTAGQTVQVRVIAVNSAGESQPGEPVAMVVL